MARCIVGLPLVKTALAGGDLNWGRIGAAAGRAGVRFGPESLCLSIGGVQVVQGGVEVGRSQTRAATLMRRTRVHMRLCIGKGVGQARALGCDLTHA